MTATLRIDGRYRSIYQTPYGEGQLYWNGHMLVAHWLPGTGGRNPLTTRLADSAAVSITAVPPPESALKSLLEFYFHGEVVEFDFEQIPVDWSAYSPFGLKVARALTRVPYGATISYAALAADAGHPGAQRAVGSFLASNPFPVLIPCHRVIRSNGGLGRYSSGEEWKARLLKIEATGLAASLPQIPVIP